MGYPYSILFVVSVNCEKWLKIQNGLEVKKWIGVNCGHSEIKMSTKLTEAVLMVDSYIAERYAGAKHSIVLVACVVVSLLFLL